eukprot:jgi/Chlat1/2383/Chrsp17S08734
MDGGEEEAVGWRRRKREDKDVLSSFDPEAAKASEGAAISSRDDDLYRQLVSRMTGDDGPAYLHGRGGKR